MPEEPLRDQEALNWFVRHRRGGGHIVDAALTALSESFGPDVVYRFVAPVDTNTRSPIRLIIEVRQPVDSESAWERITAVQSRLLEQAGDLGERMHVKRPLDRIVIALADPPRDWTVVLAEIDELD
jgi:hypothetical protein